MFAYLRPALALTVLFTILTGLAYPLAFTGIAQVIAPQAANGSLIVKDGHVLGSALIGQEFKSDRYFHGRPSATTMPDPNDPTKTVDAPYNASASTGTNLGPTSEALYKSISERAAALGPGPAPADLVTSSASGLDPDISPAAAFIQVNRVAAARGMAPDSLRALVEAQVQGRLFGILGERRVNVLALNLALDQTKP
ncbi:MULTISPECIES: potassium-transporting ATPase subunit KdpC [unclassified Beijerinckia]|uniref:potassium-transporting ATPase subunit KdpC n=1 Tax=unclassified Beijerinckia TaxID=2638183 RepID=UPI000895CE6E|nr:MULTISPECIES: potassium-transporting ATPase subunit KdpC [unclassified Beijerinckia]MDH7795075.1 K+-transporting ATPase ATPase C chain [Beijerinckia sp. GAS462]SEB86556.1 K+-transporting ATPase ATPase C chain [Beijerinckia sp. 28-YEA-48]